MNGNGIDDDGQKGIDEFGADKKRYLIGFSLPLYPYYCTRKAFTRSG